LEFLPISRALAAVSIPTYPLIPTYLTARIRRPPTVELVSLADGVDGGPGKGKRQVGEDEEGREGTREEEKDATLKYVLHDLAPELYIELMKGFHK
jgi:hypothetical protein